MKKILKRVFVIVFAATLFAMPVSTAYAESTVVCTWAYEDPTMAFKIFQFQPDPYYLPIDSAVFCNDITVSDGYWVVPAGYDFKIQIAFDEISDVRIIIISKNSPQFVYQDMTTISAMIDIEEKSVDDSYQVVVAARSDLYIPYYSFINTID